MLVCLYDDDMLSFPSNNHCLWQLPSHPVTPSSKHSDSKQIPLTPAYHTLPHPSHHGTPHTTINWGPLEPPKTPKPWSLSCLRPAPPLRPSAALCYKEVRCSSQKIILCSLPPLRNVTHSHTNILQFRGYFYCMANRYRSREIIPLQRRNEIKVLPVSWACGRAPRGRIFR